MGIANLVRIEHADDLGAVEIGARRIYILPTRYGFIYGSLLFLMLIGAVNYGNNPAHLLTFLLAGLGSNAIYQTWRNLRGLGLRCHGASPVFAGQAARFVVEVDPGERERPAIQLGFEGSDLQLIDLAAQKPQSVTLTLKDLPRGLHSPGRLTISTPYPLGLFRAWCYVDTAARLLVYPRPGPGWQPPGDTGQRLDGGYSGSGNDDFAGLRAYQSGDPPSQMDWKSYARERGLNTRLFSGQAAAPVWLDWADAPGTDDEQRLSALTRAVLDAEAADRPYGLRTPAVRIAPARGTPHRHQCLRHLALYGTADA
jgi:uncharacterized protein (DUF58 family)